MGKSENEDNKKEMNVFVTGSTGFIGANLALTLAERGLIVHALYRSEKKIQDIKHENLKFYKGDILDIQSLHAAMKGCGQIYHIAAFTDVWTKDKSLIYELNVRGTLNVLDAALDLKIKDIVFTSTAGVLGPSVREMVDEETIRSTDYFLEYERTKAIAEEKVKDYIAKGLNIRIVNPTRVYGPGLLSKSNSVTIMIQSFNNGKWRIIPGNGKSIGNYVFINDVVEGHILAMQNGKTGKRYLLGGDNVNYLEFFQILRKITNKKHRMFKLPLFLMLFISHIAMFLNWLLGIKPFITPSLVRKFNYNWEISSKRAVHELNYKITSMVEGMKKTIDWIEKNY